MNKHPEISKNAEFIAQGGKRVKPESGPFNFSQGEFMKRFGSLVGGHGGSELRIDDVQRSWRLENRWWSCTLACSAGFANA
jgi:hypothetical protein